MEKQQERTDDAGLAMAARPEVDGGSDFVDGVGCSYHVVLSVPTQEQAEVLCKFGRMLAATSRDGGRKRAAGLKPSWKVDMSHEAAIFSHLNKWKHGERRDPESGQHPLVHMAWRALAIAWQEENR
jgi:hypothetical protein